MTGPLLSTKLSIPSARRGLVPRPPLVDLLAKGLEGPLTLVCAPPGFGKTTLLAEWRASERGRSLPLAWLSLEPGDNDPSRFWSYFIGALQTVQEGVGETSLQMLQSPQPPPTETFLTILMNEAADLPHPFAMVLDDYHVVESQPIHDALEIILDHLPPQMHLVIISRADPPLPLARLRANRQLTEIRSAHLRFTEKDADDFLNGVMALGLSTENTAALHRQTEGWAAGPQLAALSLEGRSDKDDFITAFSGSHRYIIDYLVEEVLSRQLEDVHDFLCITSLLNPFSASLCDAVTGGSEGVRILEYLERANLFLVPLDNERRWYRYHHLFGEVLAQRLRETQPEIIPQLHRRASRWFENEGLPEQAIDHAILGADYESAATLIEGAAEKTLWVDGQGMTVLSWLDALPTQVVQSLPGLGLLYAWARFTTGQWEGVEPVLEAVEAALGPGEDSDGLLGEVAAIRSGVAYELGDMERTIALCLQALDHLPEDNLTLRSVITFNLGLGSFFAGDYPRAERVYRDALEISRAADNSTVEMLAAGCLVLSAVVRGGLREAAKIFQQCTDRDESDRGSPLAALGLAYVQMGEVLREWNDLGRAQNSLLEGIALCRQQGGMPECISQGYITLSRVLQAGGDVSGSRQAMEQAEDQLAELQSRPGDVSRIIAQSLLHRARLWIAQGKVSEAADWLGREEQSAADRPTLLRESADIIRARVLIAQGQPDEAERVLQRLLDIGQSEGRTGILVEALLLQSMASLAQDRPAQASEVLTGAVEIAEPEGYVRLFWMKGDPWSNCFSK